MTIGNVTKTNIFSFSSRNFIFPLAVASVPCYSVSKGINDWEDQIMNQDIAQEIIILRAKNGWTQQMLAEKLGTTQRTIAAWESGVSTPRKTMRVRIAQAFDLPDNYFLERPEGEATQDQIERIIERIDGVLSESEQFGAEEGKRKILKKFQEVLSDFPTDGQNRQK